jgi:hypothetical protein
MRVLGFRAILIVLVVATQLVLGAFVLNAQDEAENPFNPVELVEIAEMLGEATADADAASRVYGPSCRR